MVILKLSFPHDFVAVVLIISSIQCCADFIWLHIGYGSCYSNFSPGWICRLQAFHAYKIKMIESFSLWSTHSILLVISWFGYPQVVYLNESIQFRNHVLFYLFFRPSPIIFSLRQFKWLAFSCHVPNEGNGALPFL